MDKKLSPVQAIKAFCKECNYDDADHGTWSDQITACPSVDCPLYPHRPLNSKARAVIRKAKVDAMSADEKAEYDRKNAIAAERMRKNFHSS